MPKNIKQKRLNQTELGEYLGVSRTTISKYCRLSDCPERNSSGRFDVEEFKAFYESTRPEPQTPDAIDARTRLDEARARLAEIKVDEAEGRLIDAESVTMEWIEIGTRIRSDLLSQPQKLAPELVRLVRSGGDEAAVCELLTERIRDILLHLASHE